MSSLLNAWSIGGAVLGGLMTAPVFAVNDSPNILDIGGLALAVAFGGAMGLAVKASFTNAAQPVAISAAPDSSSVPKTTGIDQSSATSVALPVRSAPIPPPARGR